MGVDAGERGSSSNVGVDAGERGSSNSGDRGGSMHVSLSVSV